MSVLILASPAVQLNVYSSTMWKTTKLKATNPDIASVNSIKLLMAVLA